LKRDKKIKICFLADKHGLYDDRIYWKMAVPLSQRGYEVSYLLIGDKEEEGLTQEGILYKMLKLKTLSKNRYINFVLKNLHPYNNYKSLYREAQKIAAEIYHFHDLWINRIGRKLKRLPHHPVVFYDAREPHADDYVSFSPLKGIFKKAIACFAFLLDRWEKRQAAHYDLVISTEEIVRDRFREKLGADKVEVLFNYTDKHHAYDKVPLARKPYDFIYSGGITALRGAFKILEATRLALKHVPDIRVVFVGKYSPEGLQEDMQQFIDKNHLQEHVILHPFVDYGRISDYYNNSKVGLVPWFPYPTFKVKMPIKLFEYMAFGMPVIGSNFGHIKAYIEKENCGLVVNPMNAAEIADAMVELMRNPQQCMTYANNGRTATLQKYRWELELEKLITYYERSLKERIRKIRSDG